MMGGYVGIQGEVPQSPGSARFLCVMPLILIKSSFQNKPETAIDL